MTPEELLALQNNPLLMQTGAAAAQPPPPALPPGVQFAMPSASPGPARGLVNDPTQASPLASGVSFELPKTSQPTPPSGVPADAELPPDIKLPAGMRYPAKKTEAAAPATDAASIERQLVEAARPGAKSSNLPSGAAPPSIQPKSAQPSDGAPSTFKLPVPGGGGQPGINPLKMLGMDLDAIDERTKASLGEQSEAERVKGQNKEEAGYSVAAAHQNAVDAADTIQKAKNAAMERASASMDRTNAEIKQKLADIKDVDPEKWWKEKSTGQKILGALAIGLGQFGAMMPHTGGGGKNAALDIIEGHIHRDVDAQVKNRQMVLEKLQKEHEMNKDSWAKSQWMANAKDEEIKLGWMKVDKQIAGIQARNIAADAQENATQMRADIAMKIDGVDKSIFQRRLQVAQQIAAQQAGSPLAALKQKWDKIADDAIAKGEKPIAFEDYARTHLTGKPSGPDATGGLTAKDQREVDKHIALKKAEKEAEHAEAAENFERAAAGVKSTSFFENPGLAAGRILPASLAPQGNQALLDQAGLNTAMKGMAHTKFGARTPEAQEHLVAPFLIAHGDSDLVKLQKIAGARKAFSIKSGASEAGPPALGITPGFK